ncbi:MAG TPA: hypothetical protein VL550_09570 [Rhodocyclaceae bacterium]|nr:hypothetical protein [Rhodocyclaceae bacterium]
MHRYEAENDMYQNPTKAADACCGKGFRHQLALALFLLYAVQYY